jgi:Putative lipase essential for disintegration of autophagic bodies inside the vacuole
MTTELDLAILVYMAYSPADINQIPTGNWTADIDLTRNDTASGFAATTYVNGAGEVVIALRGTDDESKLDPDWANANIPAALGSHSSQVVAAMELLADVRAHYPAAQITLTGHSLGGGLASLLATYFDLPAKVFNPAPFGNSAIDVSSVSLRVQYYSEFNTYINQVYPAGSISPAASAALSNLLQSFNDFAAFNVSYDQRKLNTTGSFLRGEVLESWREDLPMPSADLTPIDPGTITLVATDIYLYPGCDRSKQSVNPNHVSIQNDAGSCNA